MPIRDTSLEFTEHRKVRIMSDSKNQLFAMDIEGMTCTSCEHHVQDALRSIGAIDVRADYKKGEATFIADANFPPEKAQEAVMQAGYQPKNVKIQRWENHSDMVFFTWTSKA